MSQAMRRFATMNCDRRRLLLYAYPTRVRGGSSFLLCRIQSSACRASTTTRLNNIKSVLIYWQQSVRARTAVIGSQH